MKQKVASALAFIVAGLSMNGAAAAEYTFPTAMKVNIEKDTVPVYKQGSNVVYSVVNYFTVLMPNGDQSFALKDESGAELPVSKQGDQYFINADVPAGQVVYFGPDTETVATPVRVMMDGPISIGHVHFPTAGAKLSADAKKALRLIAKEMAASNLTSAYLVGMTDRSGSNDANLSLGERRAQTAARYLQKKLAALGVIKSAITTETMGEYLSDKNDGVVNQFDRKVSILIYPTV